MARISGITSQSIVRVSGINVANLTRLSGIPASTFFTTGPGGGFGPMELFAWNLFPMPQAFPDPSFACSSSGEQLSLVAPGYFNPATGAVAADEGGEFPITVPYGAGTYLVIMEGGARYTVQYAENPSHPIASNQCG